MGLFVPLFGFLCVQFELSTQQELPDIELRMFETLIPLILF